MATGLGVIVLDRSAKHWAMESITLGERVPLVGDWLSAGNIHSPAAAMGLFSSWSPFAQQVALVLISLSCVLLALAFFRGLARGESGAGAALGAIITGVLSNAYDRLAFGASVHSFHLGKPTSTLPDFNLADVAIVLGVVTLVVELLASEMAGRAEERPRA